MSRESFPAWLAALAAPRPGAGTPGRPVAPGQEIRAPGPDATRSLDAVEAAILRIAGDEPLTGEGGSR